LGNVKKETKYTLTSTPPKLVKHLVARENIIDDSYMMFYEGSLKQNNGKIVYLNSNHRQGEYIGTAELIYEDKKLFMTILSGNINDMIGKFPSLCVRANENDYEKMHNIMVFDEAEVIDIGICNSRNVDKEIPKITF